MDLGLAGKVALVTASSRGLGRASALALSQEGARVVLCARDRAGLAAAAAAMPGEALAVPADVTDPGTPQRLVDAALGRFGGLDILVANAGGPPPTLADLFADGITLNLACPGTHATERAGQTGAAGDGPVGDPADFGKVVCFLCSAPAAFVSGAAVAVDGATTARLL